jgi:predicted amidohydrolase
MNSGPDRAENLRTAAALIGEAADRGARFIGIPENFELMSSAEEKRAQARPLEETLEPLRDLARRRGVTLLAGSCAERPKGATDERFFNTSALIGPSGELLARYRKLHLFDVELGDGATYHESQSVLPGSEVVMVDSEAGRVGLSVCYDLRFPELYREQSRRGAELLCVPSAFTLATGRDHWEVLLRARAIENQCFVLAPAQWGSHPGKRVTYGRSMIVDPWGTVLCCCPDGVGVAVAELDREAQQRIRKSLPALELRKL